MLVFQGKEIKSLDLTYSKGILKAFFSLLLR